MLYASNQAGRCRLLHIQLGVTSHIILQRLDIEDIEYKLDFSREKFEPGPVYEPRISRPLAWRSATQVPTPVHAQMFLLKR